MTLENGETYLINHSRKGTFAMRVSNQYDDWTQGVVVGGQTEALLDYNVNFVGDNVTIRSSFINSAVEQL